MFAKLKIPNINNKTATNKGATMSFLAMLMFLKSAVIRILKSWPRQYRNLAE
jgi:hypothetical protein